jgi:hypothetical protein
VGDAPPLRRYEQRQVLRALGWRGSKAKRHNMAKRLPPIRRVIVEAMRAKASRSNPEE